MAPREPDITQVLLPLDIFDDPTSADAIALIRPAPLPDKPGEHCANHLPDDGIGVH